MSTENPKSLASQTSKDKENQNPSANDPREQGRTHPNREGSRSDK